MLGILEGHNMDLTTFKLHLLRGIASKPRNVPSIGVMFTLEARLQKDLPIHQKGSPLSIALRALTAEVNVVENDLPSFRDPDSVFVAFWDKLFRFISSPDTIINCDFSLLIQITFC